ncbi:MAG TPA: glycosyl hydrolase family 18 protein [Longimicrobium sp.]|nr:glycosyl hydrolase family 18 protein [Longimicrobium sp.]
MSTSVPRVNAWIYLLEDDPANTSYKTPGSSYQNAVEHGVYAYTDMLGICWVNPILTSDTTVPKGDGKTYTVQLESGSHPHPGGFSNQQYMGWLMEDARKANPNIKLVVTLGYAHDEITQIFKGDKSQWPQQATAFANNLVAYLEHYGLDGFDVDWEGEFAYETTADQFRLLFTAIRAAFTKSGKQYYLTLSPADVGNLDGQTVNDAFDFVNLQLYSGYTCAQGFLDKGVHAGKLAYGAKFEAVSADGPPYQTAQQAVAFYAPNCNDSQSYGIFTNWRLNSGNFQYEQAQQMILYQLVHGIPGTTFDDTNIVGAAGNPPISQLVVCAGDVLDSIQATNTGSFQTNAVTYTLLQHGGNGGGVNTVNVAEGDAIVEASGYTGVWFGWNCVLQITLTTRNGAVFGPFGTMAYASSRTPFTYTAPQGQSIVAFSGSTVNVPLAGGGNTNIFASLNVSYG